MSKEAKAYSKEVENALKTSKEVIDILKAISSSSFENKDLIESLKVELNTISKNINSLSKELKAECNKALALKENVTSLNSIKNNIKDFDESFEKFKSISAEQESSRY